MRTYVAQIVFAVIIAIVWGIVAKFWFGYETVTLIALAIIYSTIIFNKK